MGTETGERRGGRQSEATKAADKVSPTTAARVNSEVFLKYWPKGMNVSASTMVNPPRVTLRLVQPGKFGSEVVFSPKTGFTLNPFAKSEVAEDLIERVDRARRYRAA